MMQAMDVIEIIKILNTVGVEVVVDGGWAVDANLGEQTREHQDLDIAVLHKDVIALRDVLNKHGFVEIQRNDSWECNFVLEDGRGREVDVHSCTFDEQHKNVFGVDYPYESWQGNGQIDGVNVRCVPPDWLVKFHTGYKVDDGDYRDVKALCDRFKIEMPEIYRKFERCK